nr:RNA-directed DNA polymerase, eukaryota, reverse transcriptase zinc-binding domain protein [Tanacetum cinerariifolium]
MADILKKFDFSIVKTTSTLMEPNKALIKDAEAKDVDTSHLHAVKRIFRYLKGQPKLGLWFPRDSPFDLEAYSDSDYTGSSLERKPQQEVINFLVTKISQSSGPSNLVADETIYKEWKDRIERVATTASSLEAEQDSGGWKLKLGLRLHLNRLVIYLSQEFTHLEVGRCQTQNLHDVVSNGWNLNVNGCAMFKLVKRLKGLKSPFRKLLHEYGNLHARVNNLRVELDAAQSALDLNPTCTLLKEEHAHYLLAFKEAIIDEERFL